MPISCDKHRPHGSHCPPNWCLVRKHHERITGIIINYGYVIDDIGFIVVDACGRTCTKWFGGRGGRTCTMNFGCNEYITHISGSYGDYQYCCCQRVITSLTIYTNCNPCGYGPYGTSSCCRNVCCFSTHVQRCGAIVGFHGRCGQYLESIGVCVKKAGKELVTFDEPTTFAHIPLIVTELFKQEDVIFWYENFDPDLLGNHMDPSFPFNPGVRGLEVVIS